MTVYMCFFFFSSRRRHTRCSRDWSSDVCSSDLDSLPGPLGWTPRALDRGEAGAYQMLLPLLRSEEHTSELQSRLHLVCRFLLEKKKQKTLLAKPPKNINAITALQ